jgi:flavorubredoxin
VSVELFNNGSHQCLMYTDLIRDEAHDAVQSNQFVIIDHADGALLDPGGNLTYHNLWVALSRLMSPADLKYILASHADPDIVASLNKWLVGTKATLVISRIWDRFVPHVCGVGNTVGRIIGVPDEGGLLRLGKSSLILIPAHFLHAEGNFQFYDPVSKILFTGDLGVSLVPANDAAESVTDFDAHIRKMKGFHQRYMTSGKACRLWANMVRGLDVEMIVPQHGKYFKGREMVKRLVDWIADLECGIDLFTQDNYKVPPTDSWLEQAA